MTTRTSASLKQAFKRFVGLVEPIEDVRHVVAWDDGEVDISTYITRLDEAVMFRVNRAARAIYEEFPDLPVDFHIWFLEGRPIDSFVRSLPQLRYSKPESG
jgi:hypothetical protein